MTSTSTLATASARPVSVTSNDLRTVFRDQNHVLFLCTPGTVLVRGREIRIYIKADPWKVRRDSTLVEAVQPSGKIQLLGLDPWMRHGLADVRFYGTMPCKFFGYLYSEAMSR
jgi:hypothetical protein